MDTTTMPQIGSKIEAICVPGFTDAEISAITLPDDRIGIVTYCLTGGNDSEGNWSPDMPVICADFRVGTETVNLFVTEWKEVAEEPQMTPEEMQARIDDLTQQVESLTRARDTHAQRVTAWNSWAVSVVERADQEATDRNWCSEYDDIRSSIIESAPHDPGFPNYGDIEWEITYTVTGTMWTSYSIRVSARDEEMAREMADEMMRDIDLDSELTDAARNQTFDDIEWEVDYVSS